MNLLHTVFKNQDQFGTSLSPAEAFAAIGVAAIASDGYLSDDERQRIVDLLFGVDLFQDYSEPRLREMLENLFNQLSTRGIELLVAIARESLPSEFQETALDVAIDLILFDGKFSTEEKEFLQYLWKVLDIPPENANRILNAKAAKYSVRIGF
ncbi:MAG: tellurite resistance TerB family protein [Microcoleaceae cyanobacterium]